jgi:O-antigen/teichoic acid export membrane protein
MGFGLVIIIIEQLQIVTTINCSGIANSYTQQITAACAKSSQSAVWQLFSLVGGCLSSQVDITWSQSSNKSYSSCPYS